MTKLDYEPKRSRVHSAHWAFVTLSALAGAAAGFAAATVPLMLWMEAHAARTGYDAGNAGILFVCTVPTFTPIGALVGALIGRRTGRTPPPDSN